MAMNKTYIGFGVFFALNALLLISVGLSTGNEPIPVSYMMVGMSIMTFCLSYLQPQFKARDERSRMIREKGMFYSYFAVLGYIMVFLFLLQFNIVNISSVTVLSALAAMLISTVFVSMVIIAKRH
ncbi:permease [Alkalihalobacillus hwajinpoensis]|uniref:permease n=1 Tax=Guptibacillus hwajinpoensis TaxID=208199 RepID=UPI0018842BD4|nr:permease [Pseudalkalibacillus hwajinpoensis]MBF0707295.1 permease [Pseudalkalibacillus hwajinpoensis]